MTPERAVIFDLFGTLVGAVTPAEYWAMLKAVADALGAEPGPFSLRWRWEIEPRERSRPWPRGRDPSPRRQG